MNGISTAGGRGRCADTVPEFFSFRSLMEACVFLDTQEEEEEEEEEEKWVGSGFLRWGWYGRCVARNGGSLSHVC